MFKSPDNYSFDCSPDTRVQSELGQIRVSRAEISGAVIQVSEVQAAGQHTSDKSYSGSIDSGGSVFLQIDNCL